MKNAAKGTVTQTLSINHNGGFLTVRAVKNKKTSIAKAAPWLDNPPIPVYVPS
jgi:hypothetical protein